VANSENYYSMFDLNHTATVSEIKEAYDNLALLLDPEKNQAPGAGEAFEGKNKITILYSK
jgi:DnaJ-class molecular chaperone